jgi:hypothetical protein
MRLRRAIAAARTVESRRLRVCVSASMIVMFLNEQLKGRAGWFSKNKLDIWTGTP